MKTATVEKLYIILGDQGKARKEELDAFCHRLFPYLNFTSNIYVLSTSLSSGLPQAERIQKQIKKFLKTHRFVRYYLHLIHPLAQGDMDDIQYFFQYYYQSWRRGSTEFDREAYLYQEIPRFVLYTLVIPDHGNTAPFVEGFVKMLNDAYLLPSLYLHEKTLAFANDAAIHEKVQKIYYGSDPSGSGPLESASHVARDIFSQDLVETSCMDLRTQSFSPETSCTASLFLNAENGLLYPCMDAFFAGDALTNAYEEMDVEHMVHRCMEEREKERDCASCKKREITRFSQRTLSKNLRDEVDRLAAHLETL